MRLVTRGRVTHDYLKGFISAPEDREPAVRKLIEKAEAFTSQPAKAISSSFRRLKSLKPSSQR
jgi:hypothetical protein